jgi:predicted nuclease of restriction endonuclease-like RecB superfamily
LENPSYVLIMLTRELTLAEYDFQGGRVIPDRLTVGRHADYLPLADKMLDIYRDGTGHTRRELHRRVRTLFADQIDCPQRRIDAFCKLLDDAATYQRDRGGSAAKLRKSVFGIAARAHPLVQQPDCWFQWSEQDVKHEIAARLGRPWFEIERGLFADVAELHRLQSFEGYADGRAVLARYNVAQVQAALYDAVSMTIWAGGDFKTILRYVRLARLMHSITRAGDGRYLLRLDGPASVLRATRRYGVQMARFLPALIACRDWRMHALVRSRKRWTLGLDLSAADGLHSHFPPPDTFDSRVEEKFAKQWGEKARDGWRLFREGEILLCNQKVFTPDFVLRHENGRTVFMEIVGFWTPEYLEAKRRTLKVFQPQKVLLAVAEGTDKSPGAPWPDAIWYKSALRVEDVLARLEGLGGFDSPS